MLRVLCGTTYEESAEGAAEDLAAQAAHPEGVVTLAYASPRYGAEAFARAVQERFAPVPLYGCTTAGEIGPGGFGAGGAVAMTLISPGLRVGAGLASDLQGSAVSAGRRATLEAAGALGRRLEELEGGHHVAVSLLDGRSGQEESFIAGAAGSAPAISFVGGSAADFLDGPPASRIFAEGRALADAGLILLFETELPFAVIMTGHMEPTEARVVVTASDPVERLVHELDGRPAREVYAGMLGVGMEEISRPLLARAPLAHYVGGQAYVRSVMAAEGSSLRFAGAVEDGIVLRGMKPGDIVAITRADLEEAEERVGGDLRALIVFNCLGRYLETEATGTTSQIGDVLCRYPVIGFNTFGEQFNALHVNHTLTALALGGGARG